MIKRIGEKEVFKAKFMTIKDIEFDSPIDRGKFHEARTIAALYLAKKFL